MLEGILKSKFYTKSKLLIKTARAKLEILKKKKEAIVKYMKNDIADLLRNNMDQHALNRVESLISEQRIFSCYEFIEQSCECIQNNLSLMDGKRECPDDCKEAVQSVMRAAQNFGELPELSVLRSLFNEKYEKTLEPFANKEFLDMLSPVPPTREKKIKVIMDIAEEHSIDWIEAALEQKATPPPSHRGRNSHRTRQPHVEDTETQVNFDGVKAGVAMAGRGYSDEENPVRDFSNVKRVEHISNGGKKHIKSTTYKGHREEDDHAIDRAKPGSVLSKDAQLVPEEQRPVAAKPEAKHGRARRASWSRGRDEDGWRDGEEEKVDELLMLYSRKESPYQQGDLKQPQQRHRSHGNGAAATSRRRLSEVPQLPRPHRGHARASSAAPDITPSRALRNLPGHEELASRMASLKH